MIDSVAIVFQGCSIECQFEEVAARELVEFLFGDLLGEARHGERVVDCYHLHHSEGEWRLERPGHEVLRTEPELNDLALILLNRVLLSFADSQSNSISLHAGLVSDQSGSILMPGQPGSGKSSASLWLSHRGYSYHTDEYVELSSEDLTLTAFTRPFVVRRHVYEIMQHHLSAPNEDVQESLHRMFLAKHVGYIAHRRINPVFSRAIPALKAIVFPVYNQSGRNQLTEISRARVGMELLVCQFGRQVYKDHGFSSISSLVKTVPAYLLLYNQFDHLEALLGDLA